MSVHWTVGLVVYPLAAIAPSLLSAQTATVAPMGQVALPSSTPAAPRSTQNKKVVASYDSVADSTHLSVMTHKGKYFLSVQRPRLIWTVAYAGRTPGPPPPSEVRLEFRTQSPQVALDSRLVISFSGGRRLEVGSAGAFSDPGVQTWSHFMRFFIPSASLAEALASSDEVTVTVGGITERLKPEHRSALRDLLERVGAGSASGTSKGGT